MRALLFIVGLAVLVLIGAMMLGLVSIDMVRPGAVQTPKFEADVGRVDVGTENRTVQVPTIDIERADNTQTAQ
ncbi:hypothetical protein ACBY01_13925 [Sphingomonas sp. ac-8]|uniref:hypothetical protein n=1 Tax=Sphingomonas sp. ac-8 TaxID=3242977 RepID=UPI003A810D35